MSEREPLGERLLRWLGARLAALLPRRLRFEVMMRTLDDAGIGQPGSQAYQVLVSSFIERLWERYHN